MIDTTSILILIVSSFLFYCVVVSRHLTMSSKACILIGLLRRHYWSKKNIFRIIGVLLLQLAFAPGRWIERWLFDKKVRSTTLSKDPIFIIGHWRSGTTHLHNLFVQDPQFSYCSLRDTMQPFTNITNWSWPFFAFAVPEVREVDGMKMGADGAQEEEIALKLLAKYCWLQVEYFPKDYETFFKRDILFQGPDGATAKKSITEAIWYWTKKLTFKYGGKQLVLKNPSNTGRVPLLLQLYPNAKFIHIHRNPYDVFPSQIKNMAWIFQYGDLQDTDRFKMAEEFTEWTYPQFMKLTLEYQNQIPADQYYELSFDDLEQRPVEVMKEIYAKFGISGFSEKRLREYLFTVSDHKKNTFSMHPTMIEKINKNLEFVFKKYNYPMKSVGGLQK